MTNKPDIERIVSEVMAGGRRMPPLPERIRQRDAHLAELREQNAAAAQQVTTSVTADTSDGASAYYDEKQRTGNNFTGD